MHCPIFAQNDILTFHFRRLPFNWKTPLGYSIAIAFEGATLHSVTLGFTPIFCIFLGSAWLEIAFIEDIANDLAEVNSSIDASNGNKRRDLTERFCYIIRFYSDAKQLSSGADNRMGVVFAESSIQINWFDLQLSVDSLLSSRKSLNLTLLWWSCGRCYVWLVHFCYANRN